MSDLREMRVNTLRSYPLLSRAGSRPASPAAVGETQKSLFMHLHKATLPSTVFLSMLTAIALVGCSEASQAPPAPQAPEVSVVTVHRASVPVTTELPGRTSPLLVAQVRARVDGIVLSRPFTEGADVNASQLLYQIDPAPYRAALASAAALLATVQQLDPIYVDLNQSSVQGLQLRRDVASGRLKLTGPDQAKVTLLLEDGTQYPLAGSLQFTDVTVDQGTGSVTVRALFPNPKAVLLPGMFVRARIDQGVNDNVVLVPQVGVTRDANGKATTLVVGASNKWSLRAIQATRTTGTDWVVEDGLNDGEKVIVAGVQKVQPGATARAVDVASAAPAPVASTPKPF